MTYITTHAAKCMLAAWTSYRAHLGKLRCDHADMIDAIDTAAKALGAALERDKARTLDGDPSPHYAADYPGESVTL